MASQFMFNLQDASCLLMEQLIFFHDHTMFFVLFILSLVFYIIMCILLSNLINLKLLFNESIEFIWTVFPALILAFIALPSLKVLYMTDEVIDPDLTIKAIGHQWNWSYEYSDFDDIEFSSYMKPNVEQDEFRLLEVDNRVVIPLGVKIRIIVSSTDVIHSWTVPSLGVKMDANPGRLNQLLLQSSRMGLFYGQCSEICGSLHSFMPICVEVVDLSTFIKWLGTK